MTIWLPEALQRQIRALPQWSAIALRQPQDSVAVRISSEHGECDVTRTSVVAALRPLTLALGLDEQTESVIKTRADPLLNFVDLASARTVGTLQLHHVRNCERSGARIALFEVVRSAQWCVRWPYRPWNRWLQNRAMRRNVDPNNFSMAPDAVQQMMIFYICPRPVVLVAVDDGRHSNLFPMDLIGAVSARHFTLALRSTSQSIETMKSARRVVLSDIAGTDRAIAYQLGAQHRNVQLDWGGLPFKILRSRNFSLPYPDIALRIREVEILDFESIGSHTFFIAHIASDESVADTPRLSHTSGLYRCYRSSRGRPFQAAT